MNRITADKIIDKTAEDECPKCGQDKCLQHGYYANAVLNQKESQMNTDLLKEMMDNLLETAPVLIVAMFVVLTFPVWVIPYCIYKSVTSD